MKFSPSTGCFYPADIEYSVDAIPIDAVEVSEDDFATAMARPAGSTVSVVRGSLVVTEPTAGELLETAKAAKIAELNAAYQAAILAPVSFTTAAGVTASFPQSDPAKNNLSQCIEAGSASWGLNLWLDANGTPVSPFTFADLQGLAVAVAAPPAPDFQALLAKIAMVQAATAIKAVEAISF